MHETQGEADAIAVSQIPPYSPYSALIRECCRGVSNVKRGLLYYEGRSLPLSWLSKMAAPSVNSNQRTHPLLHFVNNKIRRDPAVP